MIEIKTSRQLREFIIEGNSIYNLKVIGKKIYQCECNLVYRISYFVRDIFYYLFSKTEPNASLISLIKNFEEIESFQQINRKFSWIEKINGMKSLVEVFNSKCIKRPMPDSVFVKPQENQKNSSSINTQMVNNPIDSFDQGKSNIYDVDSLRRTLEHNQNSRMKSNKPRSTNSVKRQRNIEKKQIDKAVNTIASYLKNSPGQWMYFQFDKGAVNKVSSKDDAHIKIKYEVLEKPSSESGLKFLPPTPSFNCKDTKRFIEKVLIELACNQGSFFGKPASNEQEKNQWRVRLSFEFMLSK